jgi:tRNA (guanine37-N1)-methyltransferase
VIHSLVDEEISIGDYVISGGELAAGVLIDAVSRRIPKVLGHADSADQDSFSTAFSGLLEAPLFTRPREFLGFSAPEALLSGNHKKISEWKRDASVLVTLAKRPDLLFEIRFSEPDKERLIQFWENLSVSERLVLGLENLKLDDFELLQKGPPR